MFGGCLFADVPGSPDRCEKTFFGCRDSYYDKVTVAISNCMRTLSAETQMHLRRHAQSI